MKKFKCLLLIFFIFLFGSNKVLANPYPRTYESGGRQIVNCTWYAWQAAKDRAGVELPSWSYVYTWADKAKKAGFSVGMEPRANSILVLDYRKSWGYNAGHVAYVTKVEGDKVTYDEGGQSFSQDGISTGNVWTIQELELMGLAGFIYLDVPRVTTTKVTTTKKPTTKATTTSTTTTTTTTITTTTTTTTTTTITVPVTTTSIKTTLTTSKSNNDDSSKKLKFNLIISISMICAILVLLIISFLIIKK